MSEFKEIIDEVKEEPKKDNIEEVVGIKRISVIKHKNKDNMYGFKLEFEDENIKPMVALINAGDSMLYQILMHITMNCNNKKDEK